MDSRVLIGIAEIRGLIDPKQPLEERLKCAMRASLGHWCVLDEQNQFRMAVGAVLLEANDQERERINGELKLLSSLGVAAAGVPVDFAALAKQLEGREGQAVGLRKLWDEVKNEQSNSPNPGH